MSIFEPVDVPCPACGTSNPISVVYSVNADRRPDLREAILDDSFQQQPCSACGEPLRVAPRFTYLDVARGQWILVLPVDDPEAWGELEQAARDAWARAFGDKAPPAARKLASKVTARVTLGWAGLREKLLCRAMGLDDATLELLKLAYIRGRDASKLSDATELRLVDHDGDTLVLAWITSATGAALELLRVPRAAADAIEAEAAEWQALRDALTAGPYVDFHRLLVAARGLPDAPTA